MKKLIAVLLCLVMVLSLAACGDDKKDGGSIDLPNEPVKTGIVDNWKAEVALTDYMDMGDLSEMEGYMDFDKLVIAFKLEFTKSGEYTLEVDSKSVDKLIDAMVDGMEAYLKAAAKEAGMSYKDMLSLMGCSSVREFLEEMGLLDGMDELKNQKTTGEYTWEDGVLTLDGEEVDAELDGNYLTVENDDMTLKFKRN